MRNLVYIFVGRTGTTLFWSSMSQYPSIFDIGGEIFSDLAKATKGFGDPRAEKTYSFSVAQAEQTRLINDHLPGVEGKVSGFKTKVYDIIDKDLFVEQMADADPFIVVGWRENLLKHTVSGLRVRELQKQVQSLGQDIQFSANYTRKLEDLGITPAPKMHYDVQTVIDRVGQSLKWRRDLFDLADRVPCDKLWLPYESILGRQQEAMDLLCDTVGVRRVPVSDNVKKHTSDYLPDVIGNYDEVVQAVEREYGDELYRSGRWDGETLAYYGTFSVDNTREG